MESFGIAVILLPTAERTPGEVHREHRDILAAVAQRRDVDREYIETVKKVGSEKVRVAHLLQIAIRCGHQAHIAANRANAAQALELLLLQYAKQLWLKLKGISPTSSRKQRSLVRQLESADFLRDRPGKCPLFVPKQLAFKQPHGDCRTVHLHERAALPWSALVKSARNQLFAGACLAINQHGRVRTRDCLDLVQDFANSEAPSKDLAGCLGLMQFLFEIQFVSFSRRLSDSTFENASAFSSASAS